VNGEPTKAAQKIKPGDEIRYRVQGWDRILKVRTCIAKRVSAPVAAECYEDLTPERERIAIPIMFKRDRGAGRPTKKERRELDRLRGRDGNFGRMDH